MDWLDWVFKVATLATAIGATIAVVRQIKVGQDQVQQSLEARHDLSRPLLAPDGTRFFLTVGHSKDLEGREYPFADLNHLRYTVALLNIGAGPALGVRGVIYGPPPASGNYETHHFFKYGGPILTTKRAGGSETDNVEEETSQQGVVILSGGATVEKEGRYTLYAPPLPSPGEIVSGVVPVIVARLTVTYTDTFGIKHASIFDYGMDQEWRAVNVGFFSNIPKTIDELDREVQAKQGVAQSAYREELAQHRIMPNE